MNPTLLPCILSGGTYSSTLWAVHPCTQGFELILGCYYLPQTQKTSFFPLFLVSWGRNNNLQPPKAAFCEGGTMAHQNLKRKWGVTMLLSELPRLELAKRGENGIFPHTPHLFMLCVSPSFSILCNSGSASVSTSLHFSQV